MWCKEVYTTTATYKMQLAADKLNSWTEKWCVAVNKDKSSATLFTLSPKQKAGTITLGGTPLKEDEEATYLGITFDKRQTWKQHIAKAEAKVRRRLAILCKLAGTTRGAIKKMLSVPRNSQIRSWVWLHSVVNHSKDQPTGPWQGPESGTSSDYWGNVVNIDHRNGEAHRSPTSQSKEGRQEHDTDRKVQVHDKPSHENQAGRSHQEPAEKKQFCPWEQEVSRQTAPEHTSLLPARHVRALGNGHNWHQCRYHSPFPFWRRHTGWYGKAVSHPGYDCWEISTGSMAQCIHQLVSNECSDQQRGRFAGPLARRTESLSKHGRWKALLQLPCRNWSPHTGCLHSAGFRSCLQTGCLPLWRPLHPAGISKPQAPKPGQSPTTNCSYQEGCPTVDSSPLRNIRGALPSPSNASECKGVT